MTVEQLRLVAKRLNVKVTSRMRKADLQAAIDAARPKTPSNKDAARLIAAKLRKARRFKDTNKGKRLLNQAKRIAAGWGVRIAA